jgi:site-specific recombinase XerD
MNTPEEFQKYLLAGGRSEATASNYASDLRKFQGWVSQTGVGGQTDFGSAAEAFITDLRDDPEASSASVLRYMSALRSYWKFASRTDPTVTQPFVDYRGPRSHKMTAHPLPGMMADVDAMIRSTYRPHHKILIALCGYAGCRVSEARSITRRSLFQDHQGHWWLGIYGKGGTYREVPVMDRLFDLLDDAPPGDPDEPYVPINDRAARAAITNIGQRARISRPVASHDLRHTFGSWVYGQTKDLRVTQELLGHADSRTTQGYTYIEQERKRAAVMGALK